MPFITPYYECRLRACFQITNRALVDLQSENVPSAVRKKLRSIRDEDARREGKFLNLLKATIGDKQTVRYGPIILKHAKISKNKTYCVDVTLSCPPQVKPSPIIDELIDYFKIYKLTNKTVKKLRSEGLCADVLKKLESVSRQQEWHRLRDLIRGEVQAVSWGVGNCLKSQISAP